MTTTGDEATARTFGDRYVLGEQISAGTEHEVWRAHDDVVGRQVALKIYLGAQLAEPAWHTSFRRDAASLTALSHPGIATVYEYGESADSAWLALAFVDATPLSTRLAAGTPVDAGDALDTIGQTAFAIQAAHDLGLAHGNLSPTNVLIRADNVVSIIGFAVGSDATPADDLRALGDLAAGYLHDSSTRTDRRSTDVENFVGWLTDPDRTNPPTDAAEIGRTALALAASLFGNHATPVVPLANPASAEHDDAGAEPRYDEVERKRIRNRLIVLAAIVVIFGGVLLRFVGQGGGEVTVPYVVGLPLGQAQINLTAAGLLDTQVVSPGGSDSGGTVVSESPAAGERVKDGTTVTLTISAGRP